MIKTASTSNLEHGSRLNTTLSKKALFEKLDLQEDRHQSEYDRVYYDSERRFGQRNNRASENVRSVKDQLHDDDDLEIDHRKNPLGVTAGGSDGSPTTG